MSAYYRRKMRSLFQLAFSSPIYFGGRAFTIILGVSVTGRFLRAKWDIMEYYQIRSFWLIAAFFLLTLTSCSDDKNPVQQYGNTMTQAHKSARTLDSKVNILEVRKSIQEFYAANGRYPSDLNELSGFNGMTLKGDKYEYDPASGALTEKQ